MKTLTVPYGALPCKPVGYIDNYAWDTAGYCPKGELYLSHDEKYLYIKLFAPITEALTILTTADGGPVWEDNCLEFFFAPFGKEADYLNIECNPAAAMVIGKGNGRHDRQSVVETLKPQMNVATRILPGKGWEASYAIPFAAISALYGKDYTPKKGDTFDFNAYLCGEKTPVMHFGSWSPIETECPDFHRPEFFGTGELG
ncbi:MAG: hypothetical protein IJ407_03985 [Clostridia bacterium]|nr:hypothetical protein [Clostridia bacterium]